MFFSHKTPFVPYIRKWDSVKKCSSRKDAASVVKLVDHYIEDLT